MDALSITTAEIERPTRDAHPGDPEYSRDLRVTVPTGDFICTLTTTAGTFQATRGTNEAAVGAALLRAINAWASQPA